jgi:hypothetical protein
MATEISVSVVINDIFQNMPISPRKLTSKGLSFSPSSKRDSKQAFDMKLHQVLLCLHFAPAKHVVNYINGFTIFMKLGSWQNIKYTF